MTTMMAKIRSKMTTITTTTAAMALPDEGELLGGSVGGTEAVADGSGGEVGGGGGGGRPVDVGGGGSRPVDVGDGGGRPVDVGDGGGRLVDVGSGEVGGMVDIGSDGGMVVTGGNIGIGNGGDEEVGGREVDGGGEGREVNGGSGDRVDIDSDVDNESEVVGGTRISTTMLVDGALLVAMGVGCGDVDDINVLVDSKLVDDDGGNITDDVISSILKATVALSI